MGGVSICQIVSYLTDRLARERKLPFCFGEYPLSYQLARRQSGDALDVLVEAIGRHRELGGVEIQHPLVAERAAALSVFSLGGEALSHLGNSPDDDSDPVDAGGYRTAMWLLAASGLRTADRRLILETMEEAIDLAEAASAPALDRYEELFAGVQKAGHKVPAQDFFSHCQVVLAVNPNNLIWGNHN